MSGECPELDGIHAAIQALSDPDSGDPPGLSRFDVVLSQALDARTEQYLRTVDSWTPNSWPDSGSY